MILFYIVVVVVLLLVWSATKRNPVTSRSIPIPEEYPIIGNSHLLVAAIIKKFCLLHVCNIVEKYATPLIVSIGPVRLVFIDKPRDVRKLGLCLKPEAYGAFPGNDGLLSQRDHSIWKSHRNFLLPSFTNNVVKSMIPIFNKHSRALVKVMNEKVNATEFNIHSLIGPYIVSQSAESLFRAELLPGEDELVFAEIKKRMKAVGPNMLFCVIFKVIARQTGITKYMCRPLKALEAVVNRVLAAKQHQIVHDPEKRNSRELFLDRVMEMTNNPSIKDVNNIDHLSQLFTVSVETTTTALSNIILLLAMHPKIQEKCFEEIQSLNLNANNKVDHQLISQLPYLTMALKESMRIIAPVSLVGKHAEQDIQLDDYEIPAGSDIVVLLFTLFRNKEIWGDDADEFNPDHFLPEFEAKRQKNAYSPFSFGNRFCIAEKYATTSIKIAMVHLISNFKFSSSLKLKDLKLKISMSTLIDQGHLVRFERRV